MKKAFTLIELLVVIAIIALLMFILMPALARVNEDHRFLTLVCLAGEQNHGDWSFFGEPALELDNESERN